MKLNISAKQVQRAIFAPVMQQSIEVLVLPSLELVQEIERQLTENPALEIDEKQADDNTNNQSLEEILDNSISKIISKTHDRSDFDPSYILDEEENESKVIAKVDSLEDMLFTQLRMDVDNKLEFRIGEIIIGNLDYNGYLKLTYQEIADIVGIDDIELVEKVVKLIQSFDPIGIASSNLVECLIAQIPYRLNGTSAMAIQIVRDHLEDLSKKKYNEIAKKLGITPEYVKKIAKQIATLEPRPARKYKNIDSNNYISPDVNVYKDCDGKYQSIINRNNVPYLKVSSTYQNMLRNKVLKADEKEFIKDKIRNGLLFIKSIQQRNDTIKGIVEYIVEHQKDFFEYGHMHLKPMTLKDIATVLDRNESTISRAISNKYMDTPQGNLPIKFFFSQTASNDPVDNNDGLTSRSIKEELLGIVEEENKQSPLSDEGIVEVLGMRGISISRRTISKYRKSLRILPSHLRRV